MRKAFLSLTVALLVLSHYQVAAQNASPYWSLSGNSNASTASKLGTTSGIPLRILTKNAERIRIDTAGRVGIGTTSPTARLMVNTPANTSPLVIQIGGSSKLFMHANGGLAVGSSSTPPATGLYVNGNVGIGTNVPSKKLHVVGTSLFTSTLSVSNGGLSVKNTTSSLGNTALDASGSLYGITSQGGSYGVYAYSANGTGLFGSSTSSKGIIGVGATYGIYGTATGNSATGVYGEGVNGVHGYSNNRDGTGVLGLATSVGSWGVYAYSALSDALVANAGSSSAYAGNFNGYIVSRGSFVSSDRALKQNIEEVTNAMAIIGKLEPKAYTFRQDGNYKLMNLPQGIHYGLIAQDVEQVLPGLVKEAHLDSRMTTPQVTSDSTTSYAASQTIAFKALNYTELIPIVIKGMQEQEAENEALKADVATLKENNQRLEERLKTLEAIVGTNTPTLNVASLEQNTPNPVSGITTIRYHIPDLTTSALLNITNGKGQVVKTISLSKGSEQVSLNTTMLAAGTYNYTLYVDGKQVDSKRLIVVR